MSHKLPRAGNLFYATLLPLVGAEIMGLHGLNSEDNKRLGNPTNNNTNWYMQTHVDELAKRLVVTGYYCVQHCWL